jgi:hypothetical protein
MTKGPAPSTRARDRSRPDAVQKLISRGLGSVWRGSEQLPAREKSESECVAVLSESRRGIGQRKKNIDWRPSMGRPEQRPTGGRCPVRAIAGRARTRAGTMRWAPGGVAAPDRGADSVMWLPFRAVVEVPACEVHQGGARELDLRRPRLGRNTGRPTAGSVEDVTEEALDVCLARVDRRGPRLQATASAAERRWGGAEGGASHRRR